MRRFPLLMLVAIAGSLVGRSGTRAGEDGNPAAPRVIAAWAAGPFEARVAFDRPIATDLAGMVVGRTIAFDSDPPGSLRIAAARTDDDGRTLVLTTDPHPRAATYRLDLPIGGPGKAIKLAYDLKGVEAVWTPAGNDSSPAWSGWWPTLDPSTTRKRLRGSAGHARGLALIDHRKGKLALTTLLILPKGPATLTVSSSATVEAALNGEAPEPANGKAVFRTESTGDAMLLGVTLDTGGGDGPLTLDLTVKQGIGPETPVAPGRQLLLPWTPTAPPAPAPLTDVPDLKGGDPKQGAAVFASNEAKCANCHRVRGEGGNVGPDLSALVGRDRKEVYRDIAEPSAKISPDYVPYTVAMKDGRVLVGTVRAEGANAIRLVDTEAKVTVVPRAEIDEFRPGATSVMPVGLAGALGEEKLRDLIAFLTTPPAK
jgi:putative heme-binding domain-containing protein